MNIFHTNYDHSVIVIQCFTHSLYNKDKCKCTLWGLLYTFLEWYTKVYSKLQREECYEYPQLKTKF